jgi:transcriptional regulator with XRE-family HTH domain
MDDKGRITRPTPKYSFTVNQLMKRYREMTGLSQQQLADLSTEMLENSAEGLDRDFTQSAIARWESDPRDGSSPRKRVEKLRPDTIKALAVVLQRAMIDNGFDTVRVSEIEKQLTIANNRRADPKEIDPFAIEITSLMMPWPKWLKDIAQNTIREILQGMDTILMKERERLRAKTQERDNGGHSAGE